MMPTRYQPQVLQRLSQEVMQLLQATAELEQKMSPDIERVPLEHRESARNLVHYLAVRRQDIRALQIELGHLGLSSLGRLEAHVGAGLESVLLALSRIAAEPYPPSLTRTHAIFFDEGDRSLARHTEGLFGPPRHPDASVRIMVTLPGEAATDYQLVSGLIAAGMDVARINTAHDSTADWEQMAANVHAAAAEQGRSVQVLLDLAGPKLRTGAIEPGPEVLRVRPRRDARGVAIAPARVRLVANAHGPTCMPDDGAAIPIDQHLLDAIDIGDRIVLRDAPGRRRHLDIIGRDDVSAVAHAERSVWFETGLELRLTRHRSTIARGHVGTLAPRRAAIELREGDELLLTADAAPGRNAVRDDAGRAIEPARIPCTAPAVFRDTRAGERILFDDGAIAGLIEDATPDVLRVRITRVPPGGARLKSDRGINLPDSMLLLPSLTPSDLLAIDAATRFADIVGLSFVRTAADVEALHAALDQRRATKLKTIIKIETRRGFENLPQILLTGLRRSPVGIMVARGDLGAEIGFERMAEVQEQILWLCEAAHVPVIWATQVLEGLTKTGTPTRGEVTDAAMSARAECVMLNKGPYVEKAVRFLEDVLGRMRDHHIKKTPMLRRLKVSEGRWELTAPP